MRKLGEFLFWCFVVAFAAGVAAAVWHLMLQRSAKPADGVPPYELVASSRLASSETETGRIRVPGGWLYVTSTSGAVASTFVAAP